MALVVARQKNNLQSGNLAEPQRRRRLAPGAFDRLRAYILQTGLNLSIASAAIFLRLANQLQRR
jgi:hypothetical protein